MILKPVVSHQSVVWRGTKVDASRPIAAEAPIAFVYDGGSEAVMMATPADFEDFALGFSLNDGVVSSADDIVELGIVEVEGGIELRMMLKPRDRERLVTRRRLRAGPAGCGLCGVESIQAAMTKLPRVTADLSLSARDVIGAMSALSPLQRLNAQTHAVHAAALYLPDEGIVLVREDVGRHNALDKLQGGLVRSGRRASDGVILMTSRVSVELVQKAAMMGSCMIAAVSAPTALAIAEAEVAGITIAGVVREDGLEVFTHERRIRFEEQ
jgi:FdhD protein